MSLKKRRLTVNKALQQTLETCSEAGLSVMGIRLSGKGHFVVTLARPDGQRRNLIVSNTPGDQRAIKNISGDIRKIAAGVY